MLDRVLILLVIAAIAALPDFGRLSGVAPSAAEILIVVALVSFPLMLLGVFAIA